jgi:DNA repair protein RadC
MDLSIMSLADLESALLSPPSATEQLSLRVTDVTAQTWLADERQEPLTFKLHVARELLMRGLRARMHAGPVMEAPQVVREWLRLYCMDLEHEVFAVLYLNAQYVLIEAVRHFSGTLTQTSVYPREIVKAALSRNAAAVLVFHNHPSGHAEPSRSDEHLTQALRSALALVDVRLLDHFVVGGEQVVSFAERGLL